MESIFAHPVISDFLKQYNSSEHLNCLQAVAVMGVSLLRGKNLPSPELYKLSMQMTRSPRHKLSKPKKTLRSSSNSNKQMQVRRSVSQQKAALMRPLSRNSSTEQSKGVKPLKSRKKETFLNCPENEWNLQLYGPETDSKPRFLKRIQSGFNENNANADQLFGLIASHCKEKNSEGDDGKVNKKKNEDKKRKPKGARVITYKQIEPIDDPTSRGQYETNGSQPVIKGPSIFTFNN